MIAHHIAIIIRFIFTYYTFVSGHGLCFCKILDSHLIYFLCHISVLDMKNFMRADTIFVSKLYFMLNCLQIMFQLRLQYHHMTLEV